MTPNEANEDPRYFNLCPLKNNRGVPVTRCYRCEFVTSQLDGGAVVLTCCFPNRQRKLKRR